MGSVPSGSNSIEESMPVEIKAAYVDPTVIAGPVDAKRYVHVGTKEDENLVTAVSVLPAATTSPPNNNVEVALFQMRLPFATELRTTLVIFKSLETLIKHAIG